MFWYNLKSKEAWYVIWYTCASNDDAYLEDLEETIARAKEAGVKLINIVGFDDKSIEKALEITAKYDFLYLTVGWHPVEAIDFTEEKYEW